MTAIQADDPTGVPIEFEQSLSPILSMAYGTAVRLTRNRTEAEDLVQDAALLAYRAFGSFQRGTNFKAWYFRILTNAFYSRHRKDKHEKVNLSTDDVPALYLYRKTAGAGLQGRESDPTSAIMDQLDSEQVGAALEALAEVLECPVGTVRSRLHRGRRMLQKSLWDVAVEGESCGRRVTRTHAHGGDNGRQALPLHALAGLAILRCPVPPHLPESSAMPSTWTRVCHPGPSSRR